MTFAPHHGGRRIGNTGGMSAQPPFPPGGPRPRSTPIPGEPFGAPSDGPLTPSQFLGTPMPTDLPAPMSGHQQVAAPTVQLQPARRRSAGGWIVMAIIIGSIVVGVGVAVVGVVQTKRTVDKVTSSANEYSDPTLSKHDRSVLGLTGNERYLWEGDGPRSVSAMLDGAIPGSPTNFTAIDIYTDYAIVTAQNPVKPDHLDTYQWRVGEVGLPGPQPNDADAPSKAFTIADMDWVALAPVIQDAPRLLNVESGTVSYVFISRDTFTDGAPVVARVYVTGPRSSGYVVVGADGTVLQKF